MSVAVEVKIPNLPKLSAALRRSPTIVGRRVQDAIKKSIVSIQRATIPLTPHKTGELEQSLLRGTHIAPLSGRIFSDKVYAAPQHEHTEWNHPIKGQAKFLETGVRDANKEIAEHFTEALDKAMKDIAAQAK